MEIGRQDEIEDLSSSAVGSLQIAGSNGFGRSVEFMSQAYVRNRSSQIDIEDEASSEKKDRPLPIYLKVKPFSGPCMNLFNHSVNSFKFFIRKYRC